MAGLRAAAYGVPFLPVAGMWGSDVARVAGLRTVADPYTGREVYCVPAIRPDWAILHVPEADRHGNARVYGTRYWDEELSRAARGVIVTAERIVETAALEQLPELTVVPHFMVHAVAHAPRGAWPGSCYPLYDVHAEGVRAYLAHARKGDLEGHLGVADRATTAAGR